MNCEECDNILSNIEIIDRRVKEANDLFIYKFDRFKDMCIAGVVESVREAHRKAYLNTMHEHMDLRHQQIAIHKSLTKHYRESHLNGN